MLYFFYIYSLLFFSISIAYSDFKYRKIPNSLLILFLLLFLGIRLVLGFQAELPLGVVSNWAQAGLGFMAGLLLFFPLWIMRQMGAADVKLIAVLGLAVGWQAGVLIVLGGSLLAGVHALVLVLLPNVEKKYGFSLPGLRVKARSIPLGAWLAVALLGWLWMQLYIK
ncbi:A24 family peptidase [Alcaligenes endophyticus]|uniref:Prepilin peptidase n=1 Tax=Alcaligenes endophyticus TaxID=1929088 RepID=A0ABT8EHL5_9BURK|nr:prepilin peptidase [Alcaligenes endophyticus]MCX5592045.1 prepilin peptidase [Alcaligenes endophyticus]MDN4120692.1 prepilin peptidase [Alcaligenes endophyticus]